MQGKVRSYRQQTEEAERVVAASLARCRRAQAEAEEAEGRAGVAERAAGEVRARSLGLGSRRAE